MPELDRIVAGLRCREVLADLSDFLDEELPVGRTEQIRAHLRGCDWCERFGGEFAGMVARFRRALAQADALEPGVERRLHERLRREISPGR